MAGHSLDEANNLFDCGINFESIDYHLMLSDNIAQFIEKRTDIFTPELFSKICNQPADAFTREIIDSALVSLVPYHHIESCLTARGLKGIAVLPSYRGYVFCPMTEAKMLREEKEKSTAHITYVFPDGKEETLIVKFDEIILAMPKAIVPGSHFRSDALYYPIGDSYRLLKRLQNERKGKKWKGEIERITIPISDENKVTHAWAFTRPVNDGNYYRELRQRYPLILNHSVCYN